MVYTLRFFLQNAVCFIILTYLVIVLIHILYTGCAKIKKNNSDAKRLLSLSQICLHVISIAVFYTKRLTPYTICVCLNILLLPCCCPAVLSQDKNITLPFCTQREPKSLCSSKTVALHCANSVEVPHTERSRRLHDPSHAVAALTISVLSPS